MNHSPEDKCLDYACRQWDNVVKSTFESFLGSSRGFGVYTNEGKIAFERSLLEQLARSLGSENKDRTVLVTILRMVFLPAFTLSILNLLLSAFPTQAKLFALCTFAEIKSEKTSQNVTAQPALKFTGELPSSRNLSHTCLVETNDTTRLMYLRAKKNEWSIEGEAKISFLSQK